MPIKLFIVLFILSCYFSVACYGGSDDNIKQTFVIDEFISKFEHSAQYHYINDKCVQESNTPFLHDDLVSCHIYSFKSNKAANKGNTVYKRFKFRAFEYADKKLAELKFKDLLSSSHADMGLTYSWDFVILIDAKLYWLNAGCVFSNEAWEVIKNVFKNSIHNYNEEDNSLKSFNCRCGSGCRSTIL